MSFQSSPTIIQQPLSDPEAPVISTYAYGKDYHQVIRKKLNSLLRYMQDSMGALNGRSFDSAPVLDRAWAARSGLGWMAQKDSNLISPESGYLYWYLIVDIPLSI